MELNGLHREMLTDKIASIERMGAAELVAQVKVEYTRVKEALEAVHAEKNVT